MAPTTVSVPVTAQIWPKTGVTLAAAEAAVKTAIEQFFTGERLSKPVYRAALGNCIYDTGVVENFVLRPRLKMWPSHRPSCLSAAR